MRWVSQSQGRLKLISFSSIHKGIKIGILFTCPSTVTRGPFQTQTLTNCPEQEKGTQTTEESMTSSLFCLFVCLPLYKNLLAFTLQMSNFNSCRLGIPRRFSGYNSTLSLMGARLQSLARELRFRKPKEKKNSCRSLEGMEKNNQISVCPILKDTWLFQIYSVSP